ncbi:hypothetical protein L6R29_23860, partial [Myxococcota bacterium]|nr:hypothetical protein [Myxococcota bacterium]
RLHFVHTACVMKKQNPRGFRLSLPPLFTGEGGVGGFPPLHKARMGWNPTKPMELFALIEAKTQSSLRIG